MMTCPKCQEEIGGMSMHYCPLIAEMPAKEQADDRLHPTAGSPLGAAHEAYVAARDKWLKQPMSVTEDSDTYRHYMDARRAYQVEIERRQTERQSAENDPAQASLPANGPPEKHK